MSRADFPQNRLSLESLDAVTGFDLRALRYVFAAAEAMSIRRAAELLGVEPSSVSRAIRDFEDRVGVGLFERGPFGVRLTNAGRSFLEQAVPALHQINGAIHHAGAAGRAETGALNIGVITTVAGGFLRQLITGFKQAYPEVRIRIHDGGRPQHLQNIWNRKLDVGFFTGNGEVKACQTLELWRERVHIAVSAAHRLSGDAEVDWLQLRGEFFIVPCFGPGPETHDYIVRRVADYSCYPMIEYCDVHQETLMHMVAMGKGITPVVEAWRCLPIPNLVLVPLAAEADIVPFSAVWSPENDNPILRRLLKFAEKMSAGADGDFTCID